LFQCANIKPMNFISKIFGDDNTRSIKKYSQRIPEINALEESISVLSDEQLKQKTAEFRERISKGEKLDSVLPEAFAVVRETSKRLLNERHFDVQLIGGMILHDGKITEMRTGEGKTLTATLPTYLNALAGSVHVVTVNDYLARRDAVWMGQIYSYLGLSISVLSGDQTFLYDPNYDNRRLDEGKDRSLDETRDKEGSYHVVDQFLKPCTRKEGYQADIVYGTNSQFGFDYLRDNIEYEFSNIRQYEHKYAIVDEIDSILIDEARTPLIISAPSMEAENLYKTFSQVVKNFKESEDYEIDLKHKSVTLKDAGIEKAERFLGIENIYTEKGIKYVHHLETALKAKVLFNKDKEYVIRDNKIVIVDEFTGRLQPGRRWSEGLHQAIESKEGLNIEQESKTYASITYQNYFKMYKKLSGMTGTAQTSAEEFYKVYGLEVVEVPTNKPTARIDNVDLIYQTEIGKFKAIAKTIKDLNQKGQPVLVGTVSIEKNELLSQFLTNEGIPHEVLNAKKHEQEGEIIAQAGKKGSVTIATNMAGRGVDIKLGGVPLDKDKYEEVKSLGGLYVIGTERHDARRIDNQLRGRSGRQGDPGETQFYVSLEDSLMRAFASDMVKNVMGKLGIPEDQPIQNKMISRSLEGAQTKIEGINFDARKQLLEFDNVLNTQRTSIYKKRKEILEGNKENLLSLLEELIVKFPEIAKTAEDKKESLGEEEFLKTFKRLYLQSVDVFWVEHLENMNYLRSSVGLRAYGQRDPLIEYQKEGRIMFSGLLDSIEHQVVELIDNLSVGAFAKEEEKLKQVVKGAQLITNGTVSSNSENKSIISDKKYGRNDMVIIIKDGVEKEVKYKKAESLLGEGWQIKE
jgi:preprotein translocase subunit SecA